MSLNPKAIEDLTFFALLVFFSYSDLKSRVISNMILVPIFAFASSHHRILETAIFFTLAILIGMYDFKKRRFLNDFDMKAFQNKRTNTLYRGGDAKLMTLAVAVSPASYVSIGLSWIFERTFRRVFSYRDSLPYAPFLLTSQILTFLLAYACPVKIS